MKLAVFEAQGRARWDRLAALLTALERGARADAGELPALYRHLCHDLALARDRQLPGPLVAELNELALRGHRLLYQARTSPWRSVFGFVARDFPRAVRAEWRLLLVTHLLFYGLALALGTLAWLHADLIYSFLDETTVRSVEQSFDPASGHVGRPRDASDDVTMFGYYIWNNVSIAFRTFASGLAFGFGTLLSLVWNALFLGLLSSHLIRAGSAEPFFGFVIGHGSFELTAILLAGVAGMRLGLALLAPGARTRLAALRAAALASLPIVSGAGVMLVIAAGVEAFWSPRVLPSELKFAVGAALWLLVGLWLFVAGRARAA